MTIKSVKTAIENALKSPSSSPNVSVTEARAIEKAALTETSGKGKVTAGEADELRKLLQGDAFATASTYHLTSAARAELDSFAAAQHLPIGSNASVMAGEMEQAIAAAGQGTALASKPSLANRLAVTLSDARRSDGALREALYDPQKGDFYLRTTIQGRGHPTPAVSYFGPFKVGATGGTRDADNAKLRAQLDSVTKDLLFTSESDYPWDTLVLPNAGQSKPTAADFLKAVGLPSDTAVETRSANDFFNRLTQPQEGWDDTQLADAKRYSDVRAVLENNLTDLQVFRTGDIQIGVYVVGRNAYGDLVGIHTTSIET